MPHGEERLPLGPNPNGGAIWHPEATNLRQWPNTANIRKQPNTRQKGGARMAPESLGKPNIELAMSNSTISKWNLSLSLGNEECRTSDTGQYKIKTVGCRGGVILKQSKVSEEREIGNIAKPNGTQFCP